MSLIEFRNDDNAYLKWMNENPNAFVLNTYNNDNSEFALLHKSKCHHISTVNGLEIGAYTGRNEIKIGSDNLPELDDWIKKNRPKYLGLPSGCKHCNPFTERFNDNILSLFQETDENEGVWEGAIKQTLVNTFERNPIARRRCIKKYGTSCSVCATDFGKIYGIIGVGFIHVHHLKEISTIGVSYKINAVNDLRPVCPNCHAMLHQKNPCYTIEELIEIIKKNKTQ